MKFSLAVAALLASGTEAAHIKQTIAHKLSSHQVANELLQFTPSGCNAALDRIAGASNTVNTYNT